MPTRRPASAPDGRTDGRTHGRRDPPRGRLFVPIPNSDRVCKNKAAFKPPSPSLSWRAAGPVGASSGRSAPGAKRTAWRGRGSRRAPGPETGWGKEVSRGPPKRVRFPPGLCFRFLASLDNFGAPQDSEQNPSQSFPTPDYFAGNVPFQINLHNGLCVSPNQKKGDGGGVTGHAFLVWPLDVLCNYKAGKELIVLRRQARNS